MQSKREKPSDLYDLPAWNAYFRQLSIDNPPFGCGKRMDIVNGDTGNIYFIQCQDTGPIKIGYATNVKRRFSEIQVNCPYTLKLLAFAPGSKLWEDALHQEYRKINTRGEWFLPTEKLMSHINEIRKRKEFLNAKD